MILNASLIPPQPASDLIGKWMLLHTKKRPLADYYTDNCFYANLAYLQMFNQLNQLNPSMHGRNSSLFLVADKTERFKKMIGL